MDADDELSVHGYCDLSSSFLSMTLYWLASRCPVGFSMSVGADIMVTETDRIQVRRRLECVVRSISDRILSTQSLDRVLTQLHG